MLTNSRNFSLDVFDEVDFIHNYYERLVLDAIYAQSPRVQNGDRDFLADVACVALNRLPPRYIRHDVDMTFFMSPQDIDEIGHKVDSAVSDAIFYVESRERGEDPPLPAVKATLSGTRASKPSKEVPEEKATKSKTAKQK